MPALHRLSARDDEGAFRVVVESPRGSRVKLKYDPTLEAFAISRPLLLGLHYPFDWGFVPGTRVDDGDPLDAMVLHELATFPGVVMSCRALGVLRVEQNAPASKAGRVRNDRLITVPVLAPRTDEIRDARQLPQRIRDEIRQFFLAAVALTDKQVQVLGWDGPEAAEQLVDAAARRG